MYLERDWIIFEGLLYPVIDQILIMYLKYILTWSTSFDQSNDIQTKSKWLKSCFCLGIMSVSCSANQAYYHERNLQPSFFFFFFSSSYSSYFFFFLEGGGEGGERVLGISEGSDMQVTRRVSTLYITARLTVSLTAWSGGRSGRQSFVSLVAPSFWLNGFAL